MSMADTCVEFVRAAAASRRGPVLVVGISGPQGLGKSWLAKRVCDELCASGTVTAVAILMDDFYVTFAEQQAISLAAQQSRNPLLVGRGLPGTHDIGLARATIEALARRQCPVRVPVYDKLAHGGRGDRGSWRTIREPVDVVLFEGWFNGYAPLDPAALVQVYEASPLLQQNTLDSITEINDNLLLYRELWQHFDAFVIINTDSIGNVYLWREQQEQELRQNTGTGMTVAEVSAFIDRYMPLYEMCFQRCVRDGAAPTNCVIKIGLDRRVVSHSTSGHQRQAGHI